MSRDRRSGGPGIALVEPGAAVSIAGPSARYEPENIERLGKLLVASLAEITAEMTHHAPHPSPSR